MSTCERRSTLMSPAQDRLALPGEERQKELAADARKLLAAGSSIIKKALSAGRTVDFLEDNVQVGGQ